MGARDRIEVMHGVNLDQLGRRDPAVYGALTYDQLLQRIEGHARALGLRVRFFQTNAEAEFIEHLHRLEGLADAIIMNPGAWTHYAWAIRDALEIAALPTVEVHLSAVEKRPDGYRDALARLKGELDA
jgi:3-dehydroquinate dehydratase II